MPFKPFVSTNELRMKFLRRWIFDARNCFPTKCAISEDVTAACTLMITSLINDLYHLMTIVISEDFPMGSTWASVSTYFQRLCWLQGFAQLSLQQTSRKHFRNLSARVQTKSKDYFPSVWKQNRNHKKGCIGIWILLHAKSYKINKY